MSAIPTIESLEKIFLDVSSVDDIVVADREHKKPGDVLTANQVRHEVAVLGRILIRAYVGWPVHNDIVKRSVLNCLLDIYNNAHDMTLQEYITALKPVFKNVPDCHLAIFSDFISIRSGLRKPAKDVGQNITDKKAVAFVRPDNIAVVSFGPKLYSDDEVKNIIAVAEKEIRVSDALIIDLRGNLGGSDGVAVDFGRALCGARVRMDKKQYIRNTPEAKKMHEVWGAQKWGSITGSEELLLWTDSVDVPCDLSKGYDKPIYILTDRWVISSAERLISVLKHHPKVKLVGDNTRGGEVFGYARNVRLPHSGFSVYVGIVYRELEYDDFETNGFAPDIPVADGKDAMEFALADIKQNSLNKQILNNADVIKSK